MGLGICSPTCCSGYSGALPALSFRRSSLPLLRASCCYISFSRCLTPAAARATQVFQAEYNLMCDIASCPVPYVSLCDGIWMGLGVGLAVHGDVSSAGTLACRSTSPPTPAWR